MEVHSISAFDITVAFSVALQGDYSPSDNEQIPYNYVITNVGDGYVIEHHEFVCPVDGVYAFHGNVHTSDGTHCNLKIMKNGVQVGRFVGNDLLSTAATGSNLIILELIAADRVSITGGHLTCQIYGTGEYSTFSGFRIG